MSRIERPTVVVTRKLPPSIEERLKRDYAAKLNAEDRQYTTGKLLELLSVADAVVACHTERFTREVIEQLPKRLKAIVNYSVGVDHVDLAAARERGIIVTNTPDVLADATAEIAMLLILGAARRASEGEQLVRAGRWHSWSPSFMVGTQVTGKRLGILGMGRVGQVTARRARGFDMRIHYHNRHRLAPDLEQGAQYHASVESLLPECDFLALHCPATPDTEGLMDADRLALLPDGAIVVNTARGAIVDEEALLAALNSGRIRAAGLDVYRNEPDIDRRWRRQANTFLLPHVGSATRETRDAMGFRALDNLDAIFRDQMPQDRVV